MKEEIVTIETLLGYLAQYGGRIVSTASLAPEWIDQARASARLYVDNKSLGYVWEPDIKRFPETTDEVEWFERWFPLEIELPEGLKNADFLFNKLHKEKSFEQELQESLKDWARESDF